MSIIETKITGLDQIQHALEEMPRKQAGQILRKALKAGAAPVLTQMQQDAPRASGFLAEHFDMKVSIKRTGVVGAAFIGPEGKMDYPLSTGGYEDKLNRKGKKYQSGRIPVATVARFHEFGTSEMQANPFMSRAFESTKQTALMAIVDALRGLVGHS